MTQEQKDLLFRDLCGRLPYEIKVQVFNYGIETVETLYQIDLDGYISTIEGDDDEFKYFYKPYLFPMSSMTLEQKTELNDTLIQLELKAINNEIEHCKVAEFEIDFYNKNMFDYRGLIDKELALDATNKNIY